MDKFKEIALIPTFNLSLLLSTLACSSWPWISLLAQTATATSSEEIIDDSLNTSPCSLPLSELNQTINEDIFPNGYEVFINCLSFDEHGALERGIISGHDRDTSSSENKTMRFMIECASKGSSILVALQSGMPANVTSDIRELGYSACVECEDSTDPCRTPCDSRCERCFNSSENCTVCTGYRLLNSYPQTADIDPKDPIPEVANCTDNPRDTGFHCVQACPDFGNHSAPSSIDNSTCFACGLENCVECELNHDNSEGGATSSSSSSSGRNASCTACLADTVLFNGVCYSCPTALTARRALREQEENERELEEHRRQRLELAISLPIVITGVIVFFIQLSIYAHCVYPEACCRCCRTKKLNHEIKHRIQYWLSSNNHSSSSKRQKHQD